MIRLLEMVGDDSEKTPPPAILRSLVRLMPLPFLMVNPSMRSVFVKPVPKTTAEHCVKLLRVEQ